MTTDKSTDNLLNKDPVFHKSLMQQIVDSIALNPWKPAWELLEQLWLTLDTHKKLIKFDPEYRLTIQYAYNKNNEKEIREWIANKTKGKTTVYKRQISEDIIRSSVHTLKYPDTGKILCTLYMSDYHDRLINEANWKHARIVNRLRLKLTLISLLAMIFAWIAYLLTP